jgi:two-component system phosphate regulon sensor histidine kinase PhoR
MTDVTTEALVGALPEPAMIVVGTVVAVANEKARTLLGSGIEGRDVRLGIRHPQALDHILGGADADADVTGIGRVDQPWTLKVRQLGNSAVLVRLFDRAEIVSAEKMRVDFVANASHELRTPLATITGYAETLAEDGEVPTDLRKKFAGTMLDEARRMLQLIEDLMSLSRIQADRFATPTEPVSIEQVVRAAVANVGALRESAKCEIDLALPPDLPAIRGDYPQLVQVFDNLLSNAIRYGCGPQGSAVDVSVASKQGIVSIGIHDHGQGISKEHLPRLTERFYRIDAGRSRHTGGTGLGLAIVKHIVERHRGTLEIKSEVGAGTLVTVRFPAQP